MKDREQAGRGVVGMVSEPEMASYARHFSTGCRLITCYTSGRLPVLAEEMVAHLWQTLLQAVRHTMTYRLYGYVTLPDHVHLITALPPGQAPEAILQVAQRRFEEDYQILMGVPDSAPVWSTSRRIAPLADVDAFATALDYVHYNPVHHGLVRRPEEWPHSSYGAWVERKLYKLGWGWQKPRRIEKKQWE